MGMQVACSSASVSIQAGSQTGCVIASEDFRAAHDAVVESQARFLAMLTAVSVGPAVIFDDADMAREELAQVAQLDDVDFVLLQSDAYRVSNMDYGGVIASFPIRSKPHLLSGDKLIATHPIIDDSRRPVQRGQVVLGFRDQSAEVGSQALLDKALGQFASQVAKIMASRVQPSLVFDDHGVANERLEAVDDIAFLELAQVQMADGRAWAGKGRGYLDYPIQAKPTLKIEKAKAVASHPIMGDSKQLGQIVVVLGYTFVEE